MSKKEIWMEIIANINKKYYESLDKVEDNIFNLENIPEYIHLASSLIHYIKEGDSMDYSKAYIDEIIENLKNEIFEKFYNSDKGKKK